MTKTEGGVIIAALCAAVIIVHPQIVRPEGPYSKGDRNDPQKERVESRYSAAQPTTSTAESSYLRRRSVDRAEGLPNRGEEQGPRLSSSQGLRWTP